MCTCCCSSWPHKEQHMPHHCHSNSGPHWRLAVPVAAGMATIMALPGCAAAHAQHGIGWGWWALAVAVLIEVGGRLIKKSKA